MDTIYTVVSIVKGSPVKEHFIDSVEVLVCETQREAKEVIVGKFPNYDALALAWKAKQFAVLADGEPMHLALFQPRFSTENLDIVPL